jgi:hypothetical protein
MCGSTAAQHGIHNTKKGEGNGHVPKVSQQQQSITTTTLSNKEI